MEELFDGIVIMEKIEQIIKKCELLTKEELLILIKDTLISLDMAQHDYECTYERLVNLIHHAEKIDNAFELACSELEDLDSTLYDLYDRLDTYYETKDRHEWKQELLERAEEAEGN